MPATALNPIVLKFAGVLGMHAFIQSLAGA